MEKPLSDLSKIVNKRYQRYTITFSSSIQTVNKIIEDVLSSLKDLSESQRKIIENQIRVVGLDQISFSNHHLIRSLASTNKSDKADKAEQIIKAENHCQMSVVLTYISAINILISQHNYYIKLYKKFITEEHLNEKLKNIGKVTHAYKQIEKEINNKNLKYISKEQEEELEECFSKALNVIICHNVFLKEYNKKASFTSKIIKGSVVVLGIVGAGFSSLPNNYKDKIIGFIIEMYNKLISLF